MTSNDKDFRFMATNDLMTELQKDSIKVGSIIETQVLRLIFDDAKPLEVVDFYGSSGTPLYNPLPEPCVRGI